MSYGGKYEKKWIGFLTALATLVTVGGFAACNGKEDNDSSIWTESSSALEGNSSIFAGASSVDEASSVETEYSSETGQSSEGEFVGGNNSEEDSSSEEVHTHQYTVWGNDETEHWQKCECGESTEKQAHTLDGKGYCNACDFVKGVENLEYTLSDDGTHYIVSGIGKCKDADVVIASMYKGLPVTAIDEWAFYNCYSMHTLVIPSSITEIGEAAFYGCFYLTDVTMGKGVTSIPSRMFDTCNRLTNVQLGENVKSIGDYAFEGCNRLSELYLTDVAAWCEIEFVGFHRPNPFTYGNNNKVYVDNQLVTELVIPEGVTRIPDRAFACFNGLTSVTIPASIKSIGKDAFVSCNSLTGVYITDIGAWCEIAFEGNYTCNPISITKKLYLNNQPITDLVIPDSVTKVEHIAFMYCESLTSVVMGSGVTTVGAYAFSNCTNLTSMVLGNNVKEVGEYAFGFCEKLTDITIPDSVRGLGAFAFYECFDLTNVYITDIAAWCKITFGNYRANPLYAKNLYVNNELVTELVIPEGVTKLETFSFYLCQSTTSVVIPNSVTDIKDYSFSKCENLTSISFNGTQEEWRAIRRGDNIKDSQVPAKYVQCTDGMVYI